MKDVDEKFQIYRGEMNSKPVYAMVDLQYKRFKDKSVYPWFLSISTPLKNPTREGLTTDEEAEELNDFEDKLLHEIDDVTRYCYLGRATWNGYKEILLYIQDPEEISQKLQKRIDSEKFRSFAFRCERDEGWDSVQIYFD